MRNLPNAMETLLRRSVTEHGLTPYYDDIRAAARLTFLLLVEPAKDGSTTPLGVSRLGGTPDLPPGWTWATEENDPSDGETPRLLTFIGQINFAELPQMGQPLPSQGVMYVYSQQDSAADNEHSIQFYDGPTDNLIRQPAPAPEDFADEDDEEPFGLLVIKECVPSVSLPDSLNRFPNFADDVHDAYSEMRRKLHHDPRQKEPTSRLLGYPFDPYGSADGIEDWELLIEAESFFQDGKCWMNFWDAGCLQIVAPVSNLQRGEFHGTRSFIQSP